MGFLSELLSELIGASLSFALVGGLFLAVMAELVVCAVLGGWVGGQAGAVLAIAVFVGFMFLDVLILRPILRRLSRPVARS